ncbi:MAG: TrmH family RNA methyltransferase [Christensenellales bacterium]
MSYSMEKQYQPIGEQNSVIKWVKSIMSNSKPNPAGIFVGEGIWIFKLILSSGAKLRAVIICEEYIKTPEVTAIVEKCRGLCPELYSVSAKTFAKISERDKPDGLLCLCELPKRRAEDFHPGKESVVLVLDGVEIPGNIGTMIRMCDGAGADAVLICNRKARLTHPKLIKGSQGAVLTVPIIEFETERGCYDFLKKHGYSVYLADTRAENTYYDIRYPDKTAFVMGSERYGISREWYGFGTEMLSIPMSGECDSLNVGIAATVLVYEAMRQKWQRKQNKAYKK